MVEVKQHMLDGGIDAMVKHISTHNGDVMRHSMRVAGYAVNIGMTMGVPASKCKSLLQGCLLHDIGYLWVPKTITQAPRTLALHEKVKVHRHVDFGYYFVSRHVDNPDVLDVVKYHHERIDGKGYPYRIGGSSIPLLPRIAAAADAYESLTEKRAYRPAFKSAVALDHMHRLSGKQFDNAVVDALHSYVGAQCTDAPVVQPSCDFDDIGVQ